MPHDDDIVRRLNSYSPSCCGCVMYSLLIATESRRAGQTERASRERTLNVCKNEQSTCAGAQLIHHLAYLPGVRVRVRIERWEPNEELPPCSCITPTELLSHYFKSKCFNFFVHCIHKQRVFSQRCDLNLFIASNRRTSPPLGAPAPRRARLSSATSCQR